MARRYIKQASYFKNMMYKNEINIINDKMVPVISYYAKNKQSNIYFNNLPVSGHYLPEITNDNIKIISKLLKKNGYKTKIKHRYNSIDGEQYMLSLKVKWN